MSNTKTINENTTTINGEEQLLAYMAAPKDYPNVVDYIGDGGGFGADIDTAVELMQHALSKTPKH